MNRRCRRLRILAFAALAAIPGARMGGLQVSDLLADPKLTPGKFASFFRDFTFETHPFDVQDPEEFLSRQCGDCIDYAVLADYVLKKDGYTTRLIRIEMLGKDMGHAVCYVMENRAYLDYNNRAYFRTLQKCGPSIRAIATKVAESFEANWTFAQEFTYNYNTSVKHALVTVVKTDPPSSDPDLVAHKY